MKLRPVSKLFLLAVAVAFLAMPAVLHACPACQEAVINATGKEDDDPLREARAYNHSIYMMVATPYAVLGTLGFLVYRGHKAALKNARMELAGGEADFLSPS